MPEHKKDRLFKTLLVILILIPQLFIICAHQNIVLDWFNTDDAFYYFKTAQNIVEGQGVTFDSIARTNGFHPLWMIVLLPIFMIARYDLIIPLRLVIGFQTLLGIGTGLIFYRMCRRYCSGWVSFIAALAWVMLPRIHSVTNKGGVEAGLSAFFITLLWAQLIKVGHDLSTGKKSLWQIFGLSVIAIFTLFSRLDNVFLVFIVGAWFLLRFWKEPGDELANSSFPWRWWLQLAGAYFAPLIFALGGYMLGNKLYFGSPMPVSGTIKRWWGTLEFTVYGYPPKNLAEFMEHFFSDNGAIGPWAIVTAPFYSLADWLVSLLRAEATMETRRISLTLLGAIFMIGIGFLVIRNRKFFSKITWEWNLIPLLLTCLFHITYYKWTGSVAQKEWYWIPEMFFVILLIPIIFESLYRGLSRQRYTHWIIVSVIFFLAVGIAKPHIERINKVITYTPPAEEQYYLRRAHWLEENTEPGAIIGMTGSGSSGYFTQDRVIVNLDGLINSVAYFVHLQNSTADEYLESISVDYIFGNAYIMQSTNPYQWNLDQRLEEYRHFEVRENKVLTLFRFE